MIDSMETLVHGTKDFKVTLKYRELAQPVTESFYTGIERDAFIKGVNVAAHFFGAPEVTID